MPQYAVELANGEEVIVEGATLDEAIAKVQAMPPKDRAKLPRASGSSASPADLGEITIPVNQKTPVETATDVMAGFNRGAAPYAAGGMAGAGAGALIGGVGAVPGGVAGVAAVGLSQFVGDPIVDSVNKLFGTQYTKPSEAIQQLMDAAGMPRPETPAGRVGEAVGTGVGAAAGGLATTRLLAGPQAAQAGAPVSQGVLNTLNQAPASQLAAGGGAGLTAQTAAEMGAPPLAQVGAGLAGAIVAGAPGSMRTNPQLPGYVAEAQRRGINVMTSDVLTPRSFADKWLQSTGERIPITGTGGTRVRQERQRIAAVRQLFRQFGADDVANTSDAVMADLITQRQNRLDYYQQMKRTVFQNMARRTTEPVDVTRTIAAIDRQIARLQGARNAGATEPIVQRLQDWRTALLDQPLEQVDLNRQLIGEAFTDPSLAAVRSIGESVLSDIYGPLRQDIADHIRRYGDRRDITRWQVASRRMAEDIAEARNTALGSVLRRGDVTPELVERLMFSSKPSEVAVLYRNLSPNGRATARAVILHRVMQRIVNEEPDGTAIYSPNRFITEIRRLGPSVGVMFSADDLANINGLIRVLNMTRRASDAAANPMTGQQLAIPAGAIALGQAFGPGVDGFLASVAAMGSIGGMAQLYESPAVRDILMRLPRTAPNSVEEAALIKRLLVTMQSEQARQRRPDLVAPRGRNVAE